MPIKDHQSGAKPPGLEHKDAEAPSQLSLKGFCFEPDYLWSGGFSKRKRVTL